MRRDTLAAYASASLALVVFLSAAATPVSGQSSRAKNTLIGTWDVTVTRESAPPGESLSFPALITFLPGRGVVETGGASPRRGPGQGVWSRGGGRQYDAAFTFFRFGPEGEYLGTQRSTLSITLSTGGNAFTATAVVEVFGSDGELVSTESAAAEGRRMQGPSR